MKALVYKSPGVIEVEDREMPTPQKDEYLLRVLANGICGSDLEGYTGRSGRRTPPLIMGHEFVAQIEEVPSGGKFREGQIVTAFPKLYCGSCEICRKGLINICPHAPFLGAMSCDGTMQEYILMAERYIIPLEDSISIEGATFIEPLAVAVRGINHIPIQVLNESQDILVIGAGTIGLLLVQALRLKGYRGRLYIMDRSRFRVERSLGLGVDHGFWGTECLGGSENFSEKSFDIVIECVGVGATAQIALDSLENGGTAVWIGNNQKDIVINMQDIVTRELKVIGSYIYGLHDFEEAISYISKGELNYGPLITKSFPLIQGVEAFELLHKHNSEGTEIKVLLRG